MGDCEQVTGKGKAKKDYSAWSVEESKMLLQLMVDAASRGWRDANGMLSKLTIETKILPILNEKLRCHKTYCHYQSRLKYFKREYKKYSQLMRHNSGFGWDSTTKKFTAPEEIWEDYFKSHPSHRHIQTKTCEDYEDLQIVIGNATAIGKNSLGLGDGTDARTFGVEDRQVGIENFVYDNDTQAFVPNHNEASHQDPPLGHSSSSLPFQANIWTCPSESSSQRTQTELVLACAGLHNFLRKECRLDEFPIELENESSSSSSLPVNEGDPELVFQTQEQQRAHANEWRVGIASNMWRDVGHNDNNEN